jgi:hypothetical protein
MLNDNSYGCTRARSLGIATKIKIMREPSLIFTCLWFGTVLFMRLPLKKYKITSCNKRGFEDVDNLLVSFKFHFVMSEDSAYIFTIYYLLFVKKKMSWSIIVPTAWIFCVISCKVSRKSCELIWWKEVCPRREWTVATPLDSWISLRYCCDANGGPWPRTPSNSSPPTHSPIRPRHKARGARGNVRAPRSQLNTLWTPALPIRRACAHEWFGI